MSEETQRYNDRVDLQHVQRLGPGGGRTSVRANRFQAKSRVAYCRRKRAGRASVRRRHFQKISFRSGVAGAPHRQVGRQY